MPTAQVLVRNIDPDVVDQLKERARGNGRSLQAELKSILLEAAGTHDYYERLEKDITRIRKMLAGRHFSDSTELIREDRNR